MTDDTFETFQITDKRVPGAPGDPAPDRFRAWP